MCYTKTLVKKVTEIMELQAQIKALEAQQDELKGFIKEEMERRGVDELSVEGFNIYYKDVTKNSFDSKAFQKVNEELYKQFIKPSTYKRFDIKVATGSTPDK